MSIYGNRSNKSWAIANIKKIEFTLSLVIVFFAVLSMNSYGQDIDCLDCHDNFIKGSVHDDNISCGDCHTDIVDEDHSDKKPKKVVCGDCHEDFADALKNDIHHRLKDKFKGNPPNCVTCHGSHQIKSPSKSKNKIKDYCSKCHDHIVYANPFHTKPVADKICIGCHSDIECKLMLKKSVHKDLNCADCHNFISNNLEKHKNGIKNEQVADCYICHNDIAVVHRESIHGISLEEGINEAAHCWDCHGSFEILPPEDKNSKVYPANLYKTCGRCHDDPKFIKKFSMIPQDPGKRYSESVHGKIVLKGGKAANCTTCHGVHNIKNRVQPGSTISSFNIPNTCGKCHKEITEEYKQSSHWILAKKGIKNAPVCSDCHGEHDIQAINTIHKKDEVRRIQEETCFQCHSNKKLIKEFNLPGNQTHSYQDSYHGLAELSGDEDVAMCVDCHGVHKILPASHPESEVNVNNITKTCQKCHKNATSIFARSYSHIAKIDTGSIIRSWVEYIYIWLIIIVIGGMVLHNILIFAREIINNQTRKKNIITIPRFTPNEVGQHILLLSSFTLLAITGFALKYPVSWWVDILNSIGMTETARQNIHRTSAVVMITLSLYHLYYLLFTERGRFVLKEMMPRPSDLSFALRSITYYIGLRKSPPESEYYDYTEKAEYWALIWGTIVMAATGLILWFPTFIDGKWAEVWFIKVSETIHFYEAILATLAILVWHFFFVIFHPKQYPMSLVWVDGKMSINRLKHHHMKYFKRIITEMEEFERDNTNTKKLSYSTKMFIKELQKKGYDPKAFIKSEIEKDDELRQWYHGEFGA